MGKNIANLHINDRNKDSLCLLPGKGDVDYKKIFCKLKEIGYNKVGIIEIYSNNYTELKEISDAKEFLISEESK
jgi:sugar phosphate isomerase/epimerase